MWLKVVLRSCIPSLVCDFSEAFGWLSNSFLSLNKPLFSCQDCYNLYHALLSLFSVLDPNSVVSPFIFINFLVFSKASVYQHLVSLFCLWKISLICTQAVAERVKKTGFSGLQLSSCLSLKVNRSWYWLTIVTSQWNFNTFNTLW